MTPGRRNLLLLVVAALAFVVLFNLPRTERPPPALPPELIGEPDVYMRDALIVQHEENGDVRYRMHATEIRHFETLGVTAVARPRVTLYRPHEPPWHLRAEQGDVRVLLHHDGSREEVVYLRDDVEIRQEERDARFIMLSTDALVLYPDRRYAETDRPVIIDSNAGHTTGVGLRAALDIGNFVIGTDAVERVHTVVHPHQFREGP